MQDGARRASLSHSAPHVLLPPQQSSLRATAVSEECRAPLTFSAIVPGVRRCVFILPRMEKYHKHSHAMI